MELFFHISMIVTIMVVSLTGMGRTTRLFRSRGGPMAPSEPEFPTELEGEDRFLVNPLNVDEVLSFGPRAPQGSSPGFPWDRSQLPQPQQSPIDICRCKCKSMTYQPLKLSYAKTSRNDGIVVEISNSGHGVNLKVPKAEAKPFLSGGMLSNRYIYDNIHCHWGRNDIMGSEHFIDAESYPMECHMVTFNEKYGTINEALKNKQDGVVVLTWFYKLANEDNKRLQNFLQYVPSVRENGAKIFRADQNALFFPLEVLPINQEYFAYPGSLTTPPFTEAVTFIILPIAVGISKDQLALLRTLMDDKNPSKPVLSNRREIQTLNHRTVYCVKGRVQAISREIPPQQSNDRYNQIHRYC
ncbi:carbonic anhydrase 1 isoform X2 [Nilaparvata lugens]|uniref:carbonic anhydrase 1 isoform X2 n=1 Tax=Nilaparvata lugens TaxID=108931 RepID=UPI000B98D525|nr:carbonic anhydrase 1 isoform X2 [Nilaparvata lugens]XP_039290775.1 carbonic anhydrase 1 isoform X2 [Nilaparvata lugens]